MDVAGLIERLQKFSPTAKVRLNEKDGDEVLFVLSSKGADGDVGCVWLEGESNVDMHEELTSILLKAKVDNRDKTELSKELSAIGITNDMVRKYLGDVQEEAGGVSYEIS